MNSVGFFILCCNYYWCMYRAGICRTGEIYGIESLVLSDKKILEEKEFQSLSVTAEKWMNIQEVIMY